MSKLSRIVQLRVSVAAVGVLASICIYGCSSEFSKVTGSVTLDGKPLQSTDDIRAKIYFYPEGGTGAPAIGSLDDRGNYFISTGSNQGAKTGAYKVTISAVKVIPAKEEGNPPSGRRMTPPKYADPRHSGLRCEVEPGRNVFDFDLASPIPEPRRPRH